MTNPSLHSDEYDEEECEKQIEYGWNLYKMQKEGVMANVSKVTNEELMQIRDQLTSATSAPTSAQIQEMLKKKGIHLDESTIRGRFISMGKPLARKLDDIELGTKPKPKEATEDEPKKTVEKKEYVVSEDLEKYIPKESEFADYVTRPCDERLAIHYLMGKHPLTQGKQGTGKTLSHRYFAFTQKLPFFLLSCHEDMKLHKLFGDKTISNGNVEFRESEFVKAIQSPSVILFDEINAVTNANTFDFHALLQNRELFVKDADNGKGKWFSLHPDCKIGFSMNPKSAKYIGGHIKPSNFLGRCTFLTYPDFTPAQIKKAMQKKHPNFTSDDLDKYVKFYTTIVGVIESAKLAIDISIRQLNNLLDLVEGGLPRQEAIEDSISGMLDAVSSSKAKESFLRIAQATWKDMMKGDKP